MRPGSGRLRTGFFSSYALLISAAIPSDMDSPNTHTSSAASSHSIPNRIPVARSCASSSFKNWVKYRCGASGRTPIVARILQAVFALWMFASSCAFLHGGSFAVGRYGEQTKIFFTLRPPFLLLPGKCQHDPQCPPV